MQKVDVDKILHLEKSFMDDGAFGSIFTSFFT